MEYKIYQTLYGLDKNDKIKIWYAKIFNHEEHPCVIIYHGLLNGKIQENKLVYIKGKNIGKKNETSSLQQCELETNKKWLDKQEKENYKLDLNQCTKTIIYPMLAQSLHIKKIIFPCFVQPKLDGCRCIIYLDQNNQIKYQSRTGSFFESLHHLNIELMNLFKLNSKLKFDGELYTDELPFEILTGLIKTKKSFENENIKKIKYHIYDIINENDYEKRWNEMNELFATNHFNMIQLVKTFEINHEKEIYEYHEKFVKDNYEGIMIRNKKGIYEEKYRSYHLQKYKTFQETEYEIVDFKKGSGREEGCIIWICKNQNNIPFAVRPKGTIEYRKELYANGKNYIGKKLTVIFQELSENNIPRFPVGKDIRMDI